MRNMNQSTNRQRFTRTLRSLLNDLIITAGLAGIFYGLHLRAPWLAYATTGAVVLVIGLVLAYNRNDMDGKP